MSVSFMLASLTLPSMTATAVLLSGVEASAVFPVEKMNSEDASSPFWEQRLFGGSQALGTDVADAVFLKL